MPTVRRFLILPCYEFINLREISKEKNKYVITNEGIVAFLEDRKNGGLLQCFGNCCSDRL